MKSVTWEPGPPILTYSRPANKFSAANIVHCIKNQKSSSCKCTGVSKHSLLVIICSTLELLFKRPIYLYSAPSEHPHIPEDLPAIFLKMKAISQSSGPASDTVGSGPEVTVSVSGKRAMKDYLVLLACNPGKLSFTKN